MGIGCALARTLSDGAGEELQITRIGIVMVICVLLRKPKSAPGHGERCGAPLLLEFFLLFVTAAAVSRLLSVWCWVLLLFATLSIHSFLRLFTV